MSVCMYSICKSVKIKGKVIKKIYETKKYQVKYNTHKYKKKKKIMDRN